MKFIFLVQGEGRGHLTQAITLFHILLQAGCSVQKIIVGQSERRELPDFFMKEVGELVVSLSSPNFVTDKSNQSIKLFKSIFVSLIKTSIFLKNLNKLHQIICSEKPDTIINFYEFLGGLYYVLKRPKIPHFALGHQYIYDHPASKFPKGRFYDKCLLRLANKITSFGSTTVLAMSFQPLPNVPKKKLIVVPPLLRNMIRETTPSQQTHFLIYVVNDGYSEQVKGFHKKYPKIPLHCFWDKKKAPLEIKTDETLTFHSLDDSKFIQFMASCCGYVTTAGFESVCEAMFFGKPVLMIPVVGHYEQACNALDATRAGAGISNETFDLEPMIKYLPHYQNKRKKFQYWCNQATSIYLQYLT